MKNGIKFVGITMLIVAVVLGAGVAILIHGVSTYTKKCAHIMPKEAGTVEVGDTISIDDLAVFSNYDKRKITGISGAEGVISDDGQSIRITAGSGPAMINVFATNEDAPEHSDIDVKILIHTNKELIR